MEYKILDKVNSPEDVKALKEEELIPLCSEIRSFLIDKVGATGGHLASNLGVTELSVAIHRIFDSPKDHIIFDVGHQAYVHKMLTGRKDRFDDLRKPGGLSGFTSIRESEHDAFGAGHSSTSISAALGYAETDKIQGKDNYTVCVIGDGAYTGGMVHEGINNCKPDLRLIVVLNENGMSISKNRGAFASYLSRVRASKGYIEAKEGAKSFLNCIPLLGKPISAILSWTKEKIIKLVYRKNYFEDLGFYYIGTIDGNDYEKVEKALTKAKKLNKCVFVHIKTTKGKGYEEAEQKPEAFHSVYVNKKARTDTYHSIFAEELNKLAENDNKILAVTAAMGIGTGLCEFEKKFPKRYFDVGIAEEHALTFSAGLAANSFKPYTAIYSTFLQRGYDNIIHDIALQNLPVRILIDRAGLAPSDGATHHGIFDVSFLASIPQMEIISPCSYGILKTAMKNSQNIDHPIAIRYPNSYENDEVKEHFYKDEDYDTIGTRCDFDKTNPPKNIFVTYGKETERVLDAKKQLESLGIDCGIILVEQIKPFQSTVELLTKCIGNGSHIVYAEEGIKNGGAAMITESKLIENGIFEKYNFKFDIAAIDDNFVSPKELCDIYDYAGLSAKCLVKYFKQ